MMYVLFADWVLSVGSEICTLWAFKISGMQDEELSRRSMAHILLYLCHLLVVTSLIFHRLIGTWAITSVDSILWFLSSTILLTFLCYRLSHDDEELGNVMAWLVEIIFRLFAVYFEFSRRAGTALDLADNAILDSFGESDILGGDFCGIAPTLGRSRNHVGIISSSLPTTVSMSPNPSTIHCQQTGEGYIEVYFPIDEHVLSCISLKPDPKNDVPPSYEEVTKNSNGCGGGGTASLGSGTSAPSSETTVNVLQEVIPSTGDDDLPSDPPPYDSLSKTETAVD